VFFGMQDYDFAQIWSNFAQIFDTFPKFCPKNLLGDAAAVPASPAPTSLQCSRTS